MNISRVLIESDPPGSGGMGEFLACMRRAASTVCIVTTGDGNGRVGITVSSMISVSAEPPAVLVCIRSESHAAAAVLKNERFCVSLLRDDQSHVSDAFAGRGGPGVDRFGCAEWAVLKTGCPALVGAVAVVDCVLAASHRFGTHFVFIGKVVEARNNDEPTSTLVYHNRAYCKVSATSAVT